MDKLSMKIHSYEPDSNSIIVSFSSDVSTQSIDDYQKLAFQLHNINATSVASVLKEIALGGLHIAATQDRKDSMIADSAAIAAYTEMVGQTLTFNVADIDPTASSNGNTSPGLVTVVV